VQKVKLSPVADRLGAIEAAGHNTFLLRTRSIFRDMLTDSGANAMSGDQLAARMQAGDAYAGSESFYKLADAVKEVFGYEYLPP
jgi:tryptophanase